MKDLVAVLILLTVFGFPGTVGYFIGRGRRRATWDAAFEMGMQAGRHQVHSWTRMSRILGG